MVNFFELLNQALRFNIDLDSLENEFIEAQKRVHPDNCLGDSNAHFQSAQINAAYVTLKNPYERAKHYLFLKNGVIDERKIMPPEFLMEQMEMREHLEKAETREHKLSLAAELKSRISDYYASIASLLDSTEVSVEALQLAAQKIQELRFWLVLENSYVFIADSRAC